MATDGKGEKVRQELTSIMVTWWLCTLEAASSRKLPHLEDCPSEAEGRTLHRKVRPTGVTRGIDK